MNGGKQHDSPHIVMFKIKDEFKNEIPQLVKNFYGMKGKIEGMVDLEAGADFLGQRAQLRSRADYRV